MNLFNHSSVYQKLEGLTGFSALCSQVQNQDVGRAEFFSRAYKEDLLQSSFSLLAEFGSLGVQD